MVLKGKVAIVTGAASGIGKAIAELYAKEGAKVVITDLNLEGVDAVAKDIVANGGAAVAAKTDVSKLADLEAMFKLALDTYGQLDIVVNNAGIMDGMEPVGRISDERWDLVMAINTTSVMQSMRLAVDIFLKQGHGAIVNTVSVAGLYGGRGGAAYVASKHAAVGLTKNTAYMYGDKNIRCNGIAPGAIATNIASSMTNLDEEGSARQALGLATIPHYGKPEEVAQLALFLGSDQSSYVNGQIYTVDGGWTAY